MRVKLLGAAGLSVAMLLVLVSSVFAADPFASAIAGATTTTVADYTAAVGDVIPILLGLAVITLIARRVVRLFR